MSSDSRSIERRAVLLLFTLARVVLAEDFQHLTMSKALAFSMLVLLAVYAIDPASADAGMLQGQSLDMTSQC